MFVCSHLSLHASPPWWIWLFVGSTSWMSHFEDPAINLQSLWIMPKIHGKWINRNANAHAFHFYIYSEQRADRIKQQQKENPTSTKQMLTISTGSGNGNFNGPHIHTQRENDDQSMTNNSRKIYSWVPKRIELERFLFFISSLLLYMTSRSYSFRALHSVFLSLCPQWPS